MVNKKILRLLAAALAALLVTGSVTADPIPTPWWVSFKGTVTINGSPAPTGTVINAYDPDGINCGRDTVITPGIFGFMPVYRDDDRTAEVDEGALPDDPITFEIMGLTANVDSGTVIWSTDGDTATAHLSIIGVAVGLAIADPPVTATGSPEDTVRFQVGVLNTGNITDFYGIDVTSLKGWQILTPGYEIYNDRDSTAYIWFDVVIPAFPGNPPQDSLSYTIYSKLDPGVTASGQVELDVQVLDVDDEPWAALPNGFTVYQNYPNPFNPTTMVTFALPGRSEVELHVYDVLGRTVQEQSLGTLSAGEHAIEYDASRLASGVYL